MRLRCVGSLQGPLAVIPVPGAAPAGAGAHSLCVPRLALVLKALEKGMGEPQFLYSCLALPSEVGQGGTF